MSILKKKLVQIPIPRKDRSKPIYYKTLAFTDVSVDEDSRTISGYATGYGNIDDDRDMLVKGCCAKSITERGPNSSTNRKIIYLWMHDMHTPLGKITLLREDDKGLYFEAKIDEIPQGNICLTQLLSGTLNQFSIGFQYILDKMEYDENLECWIIKEINLFEISVVSLGCNEDTGFEGLKGIELETAATKLTRDTEAALKSLPYEQQIQIRQLISKHIALATLEPPEALKEKNKPPVRKSIAFSKLTKTIKEHEEAQA